MRLFIAFALALAAPGCSAAGSTGQPDLGAGDASTDASRDTTTVSVRDATPDLGSRADGRAVSDGSATHERDAVTDANEESDSSIAVDSGLDTANDAPPEAALPCPAAIADPFASPFDFACAAEARDLAGKGWYLGKPITATGRYAWSEGYVMKAYVVMHSLTKDPTWLDRLVVHADAALDARDSVTKTADHLGNFAPSWQEKATGYVWVGFTGAMLYPMAAFARHVAEDPSLAGRLAPDGKTFDEKAATYTKAVEDGIGFHEPDWVTSTYGFYEFGSDLPTDLCTSLCGKIVPYNMLALAALAMLELGRYDGLVGDAAGAAKWRDRAERITMQFRTSLSETPDGGYNWKYSTYYSRAEDVGHANFELELGFYAHDQGFAFLDGHMTRLAKTFEHVLTPALEVPYDLVDGTSVGGVSIAVFYWYLLAKTDPSLWDRSVGYAEKMGWPFIDLVTLGEVKWGTTGGP